jgi:hypothetical protein
VPLIRRSGHPGLLGSIGPTAVIAGTPAMITQAVGHHSDRRAADEHALADQKDAAAATHSIPTPRGEPTTPPGAAEPDLVERLSVLADLRTSGQLTEEEFTAAKTRLLL